MRENLNRINEAKFATKADKKEKIVGTDSGINLSDIPELAPEKRRALREAISRRFDKDR